MIIKNFSCYLTCYTTKFVIFPVIQHMFKCNGLFSIKHDVLQINVV